MTIFLAIIIGAAFGFVLDRVGATNPGLIIRMLNLSNLHLMKAILTGIGVAAVLLFGGLLAGIVDPGNMSVKTAYTGVLVGGMLLGVGFAIAGYCPGTGLTAMASGRWDAFFFVIGGLLGAAAYMFSYTWVKSAGLLEKVAGGKSTLGAIQNAGYPSLLDHMSGELLGLIMGGAFILIALLLPARLTGAEKQEAHSV